MSCERASGHTCIEHKCDALARMEEDDCARVTTIVSLELDSRAIVRVVGEVEEDLILRRARHGGGCGAGGAQAGSGVGSAADDVGGRGQGQAAIEAVEGRRRAGAEAIETRRRVREKERR